ncbi:MAG: ABC-2 transporter permease, partial [Planctomycetaceae bacterium]|nr:ABC-2 transporter permease [Planctomycetaceae bacterium]
MRFHVISAVFGRNVASYFSGLLGYLFIIVFVVAGAFLAFSEQFFTENMCNLDQLSMYFPLLLLLFIPAITMTTWAEEKKLGTDELLFTLPATDFEILLGKYLAVLAVYTVALAFSLSHAVVLAYLGQPDGSLLIS